MHKANRARRDLQYEQEYGRLIPDARAGAGPGELIDACRCRLPGLPNRQATRVVSCTNPPWIQTGSPTLGL